MLTVSPGAKVYLAVEPVDLRRGQDGLCALVRGVALERRFLEKKSEKRNRSKLPPPLPPKKVPTAAAAARARTQEFQARLDPELVPVPVPDAQRTCAQCGNEKMRNVGAGKPSVVYEYVQPHFRKKVFRRETLSCRCGHIVTAPAPDRVGEKTRYAPSFIAHLIVTKCGDSIPQYRVEKAYNNLGIPMSRSTMCSLLHRNRCATPILNTKTSHAAFRSSGPTSHGWG